MNPDTEHWTELLHRLGGLMSEMVPPEAQTHLLNAQREVLTALVIIYEHRLGSPRPVPPVQTRAGRASTGRRRSEESDHFSGPIEVS